ncbi:MAG TPA: hypothetical protein VE093_36890 [Polyangiaceae bacterium]|nr:hypothetical protein [Polyangiaceae bacterium]
MGPVEIVPIPVDAQGAFRAGDGEQGVFAVVPCDGVKARAPIGGQGEAARAAAGRAAEGRGEAG